MVTLFMIHALKLTLISLRMLLEAAQIATGCKSHTSHKELYTELGWMKLSDCRKSNKLKNYIVLLDLISLNI